MVFPSVPIGLQFSKILCCYFSTGHGAGISLEASQGELVPDPIPVPCFRPRLSIFSSGLQQFPGFFFHLHLRRRCVREIHGVGNAASVELNSHARATHPDPDERHIRWRSAPAVESAALLVRVNLPVQPCPQPGTRVERFFPPIGSPGVRVRRRHRELPPM